MNDKYDVVKSRVQYHSAVSAPRRASPSFSRTEYPIRPNLMKNVGEGLKACSEMQYSSFVYAIALYHVFVTSFTA